MKRIKVMQLKVSFWLGNITAEQLLAEAKETAPTVAVAYPIDALELQRGIDDRLLGCEHEIEMPEMPRELTGAGEEEKDRTAKISREQVDTKRRELFDVIFKEIQPHIELFRQAAEQLERHTARRVRLDAAALRRAQQGMSFGGENDEEEQEDEGEEDKLDFAAAVAAFPISAHSAILKTAVFLKDT